MISNVFYVTNGVRQGGILSPKSFNIYIDGLSNLLNNSLVGGALGGKRINHMLYADDLCIVSLSSAGLQKLLSICDEYCASHSITLNVKKSEILLKMGIKYNKYFVHFFSKTFGVGPEKSPMRSSM